MKEIQIPIGRKAPDRRGLIISALQQKFAQACFFVGQIALREKCFSRVRLHHFAYKATRERFPELGSQLIANAIYAVCRRTQGIVDPTLHHLQFNEFSPVFFDRHTISLKDSMLSMLTLDGRIKFQVSLSPQFLELFKTGPLKEIQLIRKRNQFFLVFRFKTLSRESYTLEEVGGAV